MLALSLVAPVSILLIVVLATSCAPRSTEVRGNLLLIRSPLWTYRFDLRQLRGATPLGADAISWKNTIRVFGVGWPLKPYGWF